MNITFDNIRTIVRPLLKAQLAHTNELSASDHWENSDDGTDYLGGALRLSSILLNIDYESDAEAFALLMMDPQDSDNFVLHQIACDGICPAIYDWLTAEHGEGWEDRAYEPYTEPAKHGL